MHLISFGLQRGQDATHQTDNWSCCSRCSEVSLLSQTQFKPFIIVDVISCSLHFLIFWCKCRLTQGWSEECIQSIYFSFHKAFILKSSLNLFFLTQNSEISYFVFHLLVICLKVNDYRHVIVFSTILECWWVSSNLELGIQGSSFQKAKLRDLLHFISTICWKNKTLWRKKIILFPHDCKLKVKGQSNPMTYT